MSIVEKLKKKYAEQDNRFTASPIYVMVQELVCVGVIKDGYSVMCPYGDGEMKTVYLFKDFEGEYDTKEEIIELLKEEGREVEIDEIEEYQMGYIWHTIEFFLTIKGAEEFMKSDAHNHGKLRTYVSCFNRRNYEMRELLETLGFKRK